MAKIIFSGLWQSFFEKRTSCFALQDAEDFTAGGWLGLLAAC
jgi:hypothetical protein